jgi:hypothetical protein
MILLGKNVLPDMTAVIETLGRLHPQTDPPTEATRGPESAVFRWGPGPIAVALKTDPIAWEELEEACEAAWWWEGAAEKLQGHKARLLVSLAPSLEDPIDRHLRLTQVVAAVVAGNESVLGVYWSAAGIVHEPRAFVEQAAEITRESLNPTLWIQMRIAPNDDESWALYTTGMEAFGRPEIEIASTSRQPSEIYELCAEVIGYLLVSGEELAEGGMISRSDEEQIEVRYGPSMFDEELEVMQLAF